MNETTIAASLWAFVDSCPPEFDFPMGGQLSIPLPPEEVLIESLREVNAITDQEVGAIRDRLSVRQGYSVVIFSVRMAVLAARCHVAHYLKRGLFGLAVVKRQVDWRDLLAALSIIEDCANRLGLDLGAEIEHQLHVRGNEFLAQVIDGYLSRSREMRDVEVMGFRATTSDEGLCYVRRG